MSVRDMAKQWVEDDGSLDLHVEHFARNVLLNHESSQSSSADRQSLARTKSIDEACLLDMVKKTQIFGSFYSCDSENMFLKNSEAERRRTGQEVSTYRILKRFNFTSERRMSSVLVRTAEGRIFAYVKGSDDAVSEILKRD